MPACPVGFSYQNIFPLKNCGLLINVICILLEIELTGIG